MGTDTPMEHDPASKSSELCLSCGICCAGILHAEVRLENDEIALATQHRLPLIGSNAFSLPCPSHTGADCSIYLNRPARCRSYECDSLKRFLQGTVSFEEATAWVHRAKELIHAIYQYMGGRDPSQRIWQQVTDFLHQQGKGLDTETFLRTHVELRMNVAMLAIVCQKHFEHDWGFNASAERKLRRTAQLRAREFAGRKSGALSPPVRPTPTGSGHVPGAPTGRRSS